MEGIHIELNQWDRLGIFQKSNMSTTLLNIAFLFQQFGSKTNFLRLFLIILIFNVLNSILATDPPVVDYVWSPDMDERNLHQTITERETRTREQIWVEEYKFLRMIYGEDDRKYNKNSIYRKPLSQPKKTIKKRKGNNHMKIDGKKSRSILRKRRPGGVWRITKSSLRLAMWYGKVILYPGQPTMDNSWIDSQGGVNFRLKGGSDCFVCGKSELDHLDSYGDVVWCKRRKGKLCNECEEYITNTSEHTLFCSKHKPYSPKKEKPRKFKIKQDPAKDEFIKNHEKERLRPKLQIVSSSSFSDSRGTGSTDESISLSSSSVLSNVSSIKSEPLPNVPFILDPPVLTPPPPVLINQFQHLPPPPPLPPNVDDFNNIPPIYPADPHVGDLIRQKGGEAYNIVYKEKAVLNTRAMFIVNCIHLFIGYRVTKFLNGYYSPPYVIYLITRFLTGSDFLSNVVAYPFALCKHLFSRLLNKFDSSSKHLFGYQFTTLFPRFVGCPYDIIWFLLCLNTVLTFMHPIRRWMTPWLSKKFLSVTHSYSFLHYLPKVVGDHRSEFNKHDNICLEPRLAALLYVRKPNYLYSLLCFNFWNIKFRKEKQVVVSCELIDQSLAPKNTNPLDDPKLCQDKIYNSVKTDPYVNIPRYLNIDSVYQHTAKFVTAKMLSFNSSGMNIPFLR